MNFLNLIKGIYKKSSANIILNDEMLNAFLSDWEKGRMYIPTTTFLYCIRDLTEGIKARKCNNCIKIEREEAKLLFADDMIIYIENDK